MEDAEREEKGEEPPFPWALHLRCKCYYSTHTKERNVYFRHRQHPGGIRAGTREALCVNFQESAMWGCGTGCWCVWEFEGCRSRRSAWNRLSESPSKRSVPLHNSNASVLSLNLSPRGPMPSKQLPLELCGIFRNGLLSDSEFIWNMPLQNKLGSALDIAPATESVLQFEVLSQPGVLIQISSELSLILLFLRKIITIFRVSLHFLKI